MNKVAATSALNLRTTLHDSEQRIQPFWSLRLEVSLELLSRRSLGGDGWTLGALLRMGLSPNCRLAWPCYARKNPGAKAYPHHRTRVRLRCS